MVGSFLAVTLATLLVGMVGGAGNSWSPLADSAVAASNFLLIVSTQRGASTETAEAFSDHPCAVSFNELVQWPQFPKGSTRYIQHRSFENFLGIHKLNSSNLLEHARTVRSEFCRSRPSYVLDTCGDTCVIALKIHVNEFPQSKDPTLQSEALDLKDVDSWSQEWKEQAEWAKFLADEGTSAVLLKRNLSEAFCSLKWAKKTHNFAHNPEEHEKADQQKALSRPPCVKTKKNKKQMRHFEQRVSAQFQFARHTLEIAGRTWIELPFKDFILRQNRSVNILHAATGAPSLQPC